MWLGESMAAFLPGNCLLHNILKDKKMSQQELADKVHMSRQQISNYANNVSRMSLGNAKTIAHALNVHMDDLYQWKLISRKVKEQDK